MAKRIQDLMSPVALVDKDRLERNITDMATKAKEWSLQLRPHIKTHKCIEIGKKQENAGATGITVSTLSEASVFAEAGFKDITYAVPLALDKFDVVYNISKKTNLKVLVDNPITVDLLDKFSRAVDAEFIVMLKVDCGYHRSGVNPDTPSALRLAHKISKAPHLQFKGILTHAGHSYSASSVNEIIRIVTQEQEVMVQFAKTLKIEDMDLAPEVVSIGSTPTIRLAETFMDGITEIRPGNYVFFDYTQIALGSCEVRDCAFTVQTSVVGSYPYGLMIDAGATALSKDQGPNHIDDDCGYGQVISNYSENLINSEFKITSLSQEHGKIISKRKHDLKPGDKLRIIPNHSCLAANLYDHYFVVENDSVVDKWPIARQRLDG